MEQRIRILARQGRAAPASGCEAIPAKLSDGAALSGLAANAAPPMYLADADGALILTNAEFDWLHRSGINRAGGVEGLEADAAAATPDALAHVCQRLAAGEGSVALGHTMEIDGTVRRFRSIHFPMIGDGGVVYAGIYSAAAPATEAQPATTAKHEFLGRMSHALRTPLNAIIGFAEMSLAQKHGPLNNRYLAYLGDIQGAAKHLLSTISDILDTANVESDKVSVLVRPVELASVLKGARSQIEELAKRNRVDTITIDAPDHLAVVADPGRLRQICVNLLENAVKVTDPGGSVGVEVSCPDPATVEVAFWDTGVGIPDDQQARIFDSFHQVTSDLFSDPTDGNGLGLSISRRLARLMNGDIRVESIPGRGSRFILGLPAAGRPSEAAE